jgi:hypothetical protein
MTGLRVKNRFRAISGYEYEKQVLIFGGREIHDKDRLTEHGVRIGSTVLKIFSFVLIFFFI